MWHDRQGRMRPCLGAAHVRPPRWAHAPSEQQNLAYSFNAAWA